MGTLRLLSHGWIVAVAALSVGAPALVPASAAREEGAARGSGLAGVHGTSSPDGSRDWELYSTPELFEQLSNAYQRKLEAKFGHEGKVPSATVSAGQGPESPSSAQSLPPNTLVNNPAADGTAQDTQSGSALMLGSGTTILSSFIDSGSYLGGATHYTGIARSTDNGDTWTDQGVLPVSADGDGGYPVYARSALTGTIVLSTLAFNSSAAIEIFRTTDNGLNYGAPVNGAAGGGNLDKEWVTCDNFPGAGQGNFYLCFRDFATGGGMTFTRSTNDGVTWTSRQILASGSGQGGWVVVGADHAVYCFWLTTGGNQIVFRKSMDQGMTFGALTVVTTLRTTGVNGNLGLGGGFRTNAFPQVVASPISSQQLFLIFNDKDFSGPDKANIYFTRTADGGATWIPPVRINTDAGTNDNWHPVIAITPDGTGLFTSWYDRRLDSDNLLIDVFGRNATISGPILTFGLDYRITDTSFPVVVGQDVVINSTYMGDYDMAAASNTTYYRTWGDNRLARLTHAHQPDVRFTRIPKAGPGPNIVAAGSSLAHEHCTPTNSAIDPGETVTVNFSLLNSGTGSTVNLVATLQATGGVTAPSAPRNYGIVTAGNPPVSNAFTFTASGTCGGTITATLQLQDGAANMGTATYTFGLGPPLVPVTYSSGGVLVPIPAAGTMGDMADQIINVPDGGAVVDVNVKIRLNHTFDGDLGISLVSPNGTTVSLSNRRGSSGDNFGSGASDCSGVFTVFDDEAPSAIGTGTSSFDGSFKPDSPLSAIDGSQGAGNWTLRINDNANADAGTLYCWQLAITRGPYVCSTSCSMAGVEDRSPTLIALSQNQPNPFVRTTSIRYSLPFAAPVSLSVFNLQGQRVATLVQAVQGPGNFTASFGRGAVTASGDRIGSLPAGVYFYQLRAGTFRATKKMLLLQ